MVVLTVTTDGGPYQWFLLTPKDVHVDDVIDLGHDVTYYTQQGPIPNNSAQWRRTGVGQNQGTLWRITHVTLAGQGMYRIGFLPEKGWGGQIDLDFYWTDRLRVMR